MLEQDEQSRPRRSSQRLRQWLRTHSSWELLRALFPWTDTPARLPVFASRETYHATGLLGALKLLSRIPMPMWVGGGVLYVIALMVARSASAPICFNGLLLMAPLIVLVPSLMLWTLPLALALAPLIAREREAQTWEVLRATPFTPEEILLSKAQGALASLRRSLRPLWQVQLHLLIALLVGVGGMTMFSAGLLATSQVDESAPQNVLCLSAIVAAVAAVVGYLFDRVQQFVLMVAAALAASTARSSVRTASSAAIGAVFVAWGVDIAVGVALLLVQPPGEVYNLGLSFAAIVLLGPPIGYLMDLPLVMVVLATVGTLVARAVAIRMLWNLSVRQVERV